MSEDRLVQLGTSFNLVLAHIIRGKLEAHDIPCHLFDKESFSAMSHLSLAIGGVRLMVMESDLERAKELVNEAVIEEDTNNDK